MNERNEKMQGFIELKHDVVIDWEQRRYEIAKDILATSHIAQQIGKYGYHCEEEVKEAVRMANMLIAELKKKGE